MPTHLAWNEERAECDLHASTFDYSDRPNVGSIARLAAQLAGPTSLCVDHGERCSHVTTARAHVAAWLRGGPGTPIATFEAVAERCGYANGGSARHAVQRVWGVQASPSRRTTMAETRTAIAEQVRAELADDADGLRSLYNWGSARSFGVEIEVDDMTTSVATRTVERSTGAHAHSGGYHFQTCQTCGASTNGSGRYSTWRIERDTSVDAEVVSPVLRGSDGLKAATTVLKALREGGARVTDRCGMHVHVGSDGLSWDRIADLVEFYAEAQGWLYRMTHSSRMANTYCHPQYRPTEAARNMRAGYPSDTGRGTLNLGGVVTRGIGNGTIEFRQHQGTTDRRKMRRWVQLCTVLVDLAADGTLAAWRSDWSDAPVILARLRTTGKLNGDDIALWLSNVTGIERAGR